MCDTYGIELSDEHVEEFRKIADADGEVGALAVDLAKINDLVTQRDLK